MTAFAIEDNFGTKKTGGALKCIAFRVGFPANSWGEQSAFLENMLFPLACVGWG